MNIVMISVGDEILKQPLGDEIERHVEYARRAGGQIHMITYSLARRKLMPRCFDNQFFVYPSCSLSPFMFPYDAYRQAKSLCQRIQFDLIYTQDPFGTALVGRWLHKRFGIPFIIGNHSDFIDNPYWIAERPIFFSFLNRLAKYTLPKANAWRVVNASQKNIYVRNLRLPSDRIFICHTPVYLERFLHPVDQATRLKIRHQLGIESDTPVLLWVGRPTRVKRLPILLRAFRHVVDSLPDSKLILVGKKKYVREDLDAEILNLNLKETVVWVQDGVRHEELPGYYQMADVYIQTSQYEGCCKAIIEAALSGLPIVSTDAAALGTQNIIRQPETGFLVPVDDVFALAENVLWLFKNPEQARLMGNKMRRNAITTFDREKSVQSIVKMWQEVAFSSKEINKGEVRY
jgi:1,2-diacylglycerol 3-alpha-glucosyltransferase